MDGWELPQHLLASASSSTAASASASSSSSGPAFDVGVVVSFGYMLPARLLRQFRFGVLNIHPSLLPRHRGSAPIQFAIARGEPVTGVSVIDVHPTRMDGGDVISQHTAQMQPADQSTYESMHDPLAEQGAQQLMHVLRNLSQARACRKEQLAPASASAHSTAQTHPSPRCSASSVLLFPGFSPLISLFVCLFVPLCVHAARPLLVPVLPPSPFGFSVILWLLLVFLLRVVARLLSFLWFCFLRCLARSLVRLAAVLDSLVASWSPSSGQPHKAARSCRVRGAEMQERAQDTSGSKLHCRSSSESSDSQPALLLEAMDLADTFFASPSGQAAITRWTQVMARLTSTNLSDLRSRVRSQLAAQPRIVFRLRDYDKSDCIWGQTKHDGESLQHWLDGRWMRWLVDAEVNGKLRGDPRQRELQRLALFVCIVHAVSHELVAALPSISVAADLDLDLPPMFCHIDPGYVLQEAIFGAVLFLHRSARSNDYRILECSFTRLLIHNELLYERKDDTVSRSFPDTPQNWYDSLNEAFAAHFRSVAPGSMHAPAAVLAQLDEDVQSAEAALIDRVTQASAVTVRAAVRSKRLAMSGRCSSSPSSVPAEPQPEALSMAMLHSPVHGAEEEEPEEDPRLRQRDCW